MSDQTYVLPGTLDLLIMRTIAQEPLHGCCVGAAVPVFDPAACAASPAVILVARAAAAAMPALRAGRIDPVATLRRD